MKKKSKGKVFVAMSGGVDSSVAAALLQKEGYEVTGVFMKVWQPDFLPCTWRTERLDAMRVAAHLNIPFLTWDFEKEYKEGVADYMIREYRAGRTPNPDVMCNKEVKFGAFFRRAMAAGADFVATGHYAQVAYDKKSGTYRMLTGVDAAKDQSYFLWTLGQAQLAKTFFPIGGFEKARVRTLAKKFGIPVADKKDSQGLCFMGKLNVKDFLAHFIEEKEGSVVNERGEVIGTHRGAYFYTLGERHGFTITKKTTEDAPYYVIAKDLAANTVTVAHQATRQNFSAHPNFGEIKAGKKNLSGQEKPLECASQALQASQANFCRGAVLDTAKTYIARVRYHGEPHPCRVTSLHDNAFELELETPAVFDAGQSVVLYDKDECLGGGVIHGKVVDTLAAKS